MTGKQLTINGLQARGFTVDPNAKTSKYLVFVKPGHNRSYLVGSAGGLRVINNGGSVARSVSLTGMAAHKAFQEVGRVAASLTSVEHADSVYQNLLGLRRAAATPVTVPDSPVVEIEPTPMCEFAC